MMTVRSYNTAGTTPVIVRLTNIGEPSSLTPAQVMDRQTYYRYTWISLMPGMNVNMIQLVLLHLASYLHLLLFLDWIGNSTGNYTSAIWAKIQDIKECIKTLSRVPQNT